MNNIIKFLFKKIDIPYTTLMIDVWAIISLLIIFIIFPKSIILGITIFVIVGILKQMEIL